MCFRKVILFFSVILISSCACSSDEPDPGDALMDYVLSPYELADTEVPLDDKVLGLYSGSRGYYLICVSNETGKQYRRKLGSRDSYVVGMREELKYSEGIDYSDEIVSAANQVVQ